MEVNEACGGIFDVGELSDNDEPANGQKSKTLGEIENPKRGDCECKNHVQ